MLISPPSNLLSRLLFGTRGNIAAPILLVGEAWGQEEAMQQKALVGQSGLELSRMLTDAGLSEADFLMTNVIAARPQNNEMWRFFNPKNEGATLRGLNPTEKVMEGLQNLHDLIKAQQPRLIIAAGNYPLWALTSKTSRKAAVDRAGKPVNFWAPAGIATWRGSMLYEEISGANIPLLPIIHPAAILRQWSQRFITVHDLRTRVPQAVGDWRPIPAPVVIAPPTFDQATDYLSAILARAGRGERVRLVIDVETSRRLLTCLGLATNSSVAMSIPFVRREGRGLDSYWPQDHEVAITRLLQKVLSHPQVECEGQNFLYDIQYIQYYLGVTPKISFDTMLAHHLLFPGTLKGLDYISSLYCRHYWYWKDDGKEWDAKGDLNQLLEYNAMDCLRTFECATVLRQLIVDMGMEELWEERLDNNQMALEMMNRGVRGDRALQSKLAGDLMKVRYEIETWLEYIAPQAMVSPGIKTKTRWYNSPKQTAQFLYSDLGLTPVFHRKTKNITVGKEALLELEVKYPMWKRLLQALGKLRSVEEFASTFVGMKFDLDGRIRCSNNTSGTETFRWSSSKNAFGRGMNLQNIPKGDED